MKATVRIAVIHLSTFMHYLYRNTEAISLYFGTTLAYI